MGDAGRWGWWFAPRPVEAGDEQRFPGVPVPGKQGLHAATRVLGALPFARSDLLCRVWLDGEVVEQDGQLAATRRQVGWAKAAGVTLHAHAVRWVESALGRALGPASAHRRAAESARDRALEFDDVARDREWNGDPAVEAWAEAAAARAEADVHEAACAVREDAGLMACQRAVECLVHASSMRGHANPTDRFEAELRGALPADPKAPPAPPEPSARRPPAPREQALSSLALNALRSRRGPPALHVRGHAGAWKQDRGALPRRPASPDCVWERQLRHPYLGSAHRLRGGGLFVRKTRALELRESALAWSQIAFSWGAAISVVVGADVAAKRFGSWYQALDDIDEAEVRDARASAPLPVLSGSKEDRFDVAMALLRPAVRARLLPGPDGLTACIEAPSEVQARQALQLAHLVLSEPVLAWAPGFAVRSPGCSWTPEAVPSTPPARPAAAAAPFSLPDALPSDVPWRLWSVVFPGTGPAWLATTPDPDGFVADLMRRGGPDRLLTVVSSERLAVHPAIAVVAPSPRSRPLPTHFLETLDVRLGDPPLHANAPSGAAPISAYRVSPPFPLADVPGLSGAGAMDLDPGEVHVAHVFDALRLKDVRRALEAADPQAAWVFVVGASRLTPGLEPFQLRANEAAAGQLGDDLWPYARRFYDALTERAYELS